MPNILSIHTQLFDYLVEWSNKHRYADNESNPFFYIRSSNDKRFKEGYWFPGNEDYLCLSLWTGGDSLNKTPNVYLDVTDKGDCRGLIIARDSEDKLAYFEKLVAFLREFGVDYRSTKRKGIWENRFKDKGDYMASLKSYLLEDKFLVDLFVLEHDPLSYINDYSSHFGLLAAGEFEDNYARVRAQKSILETERALKEAERSASAVTQSKGFNFGSPFPPVGDWPGGLPYALRDLNIKNYQGIRDTALFNLPAASKWIFITGENGYGKSSVLQAITLGLNDDRVLDGYLDAESRIEVVLHASGASETMVRLKTGTRGSVYNKPNQMIIAYGPVRLNTFSPDSQNQEDTTLNNVMNLFRTTTRLKSLQYELFAKTHTDPQVFKKLEKAVKEVTNDRISAIEVVGENVLFRETLSNGEVLPAIPLENLAAGFRSVINIIGDIIIRYSDRTSFSDYKDYCGLVLIDEIENHLHPLLQRELPDALSKVFPKIQFIATTHSPIPLLGAPKNSVILTVLRNLEEGITVERLDDQIDFSNLLPNTILTSPIFGFEKIIPSSNTDISAISTTDDFASSEEVKEIRQSLNLKKIDFEAIDRDFGAQQRTRDLDSDADQLPT